MRAIRSRSGRHRFAVCFLAALLASCSVVHRHAAVPVHHTHSSVAYPWRGVSLDVARHFFSPATLRRFIDLAAHYRLNVVHLHLSDNEAWRLPSRRYPRLPSPQHYTESDLRGLVTYATRRGVLIVPEIDMPAHAGAAIAAYPGLACGSADTLCPNKAQQFAAIIVHEAMEIFPGPYVHTGGDEVQGWSLSQRIAFERALAASVERAHKTMVVWDDEADAAPANTLVEVWHLGDAPSRARRYGHDVIVASDGPLYFDAVQGAPPQEPPGSRYMSTLEQVYSFSVPVHAYGVEGVVWTEHITSDSQLWYALLPRMIALSVLAKGPAHKPPWRVFEDRTLPNELQWLLDHHYAFRVPNTLIAVADSSARYTSVAGNPDGSIAITSESRVPVVLNSVVLGAAIRYRMAGDPRWHAYAVPFFVRTSPPTGIQAVSVSPDGNTGAVTELSVRASTRPRGSLHFDDIVSP